MAPGQPNAMREHVLCNEQRIESNEPTQHTNKQASSSSQARDHHHHHQEPTSSSEVPLTPTRLELGIVVHAS
jgi:hypothetical protein